MENKQVKRVYWDCEFTGLHKDTTLISIALASEDGHCFYAEFNDYAEDQVDEFIEDFILDKLVMTHLTEEHSSRIDNVIYVKGDTKFIAKVVDKWLSRYNGHIIEMWSDCLSYDWVLFVNLYGTAFDLPENIYYIPFDICTLMKATGVDPDINREEFIKSEGLMMNKNNKHNALNDTLVIKACHDKLIKMIKEK